MSPYDLLDKKVRVTSPLSMYYNREGTVASVSLDGSGVFSLKVEFSDMKWDYSFVSLNDIEEVVPKKKDGCECGSSAVGSPRHSYYCKLYKEDQ